MKTKKKSDVYKIEQFLPSAEVCPSGISQLEAEAMQFFHQYDTVKAFIDIGNFFFCI